MRAIVLSAGQGKRLLPLTAEQPKCLLPIDGDRPVLEVQLRALARCGVERATVVVGFGAAHVESFLERHPVPGLAIDTLFNPFFANSDNLATCWLARGLMDGDFLLLNGDTVFEDRVLMRVLDGPRTPMTVTIDHKARYDDDDMKVSIDDEGRLLAIGKNLKPEMVNGESIGMLCFRGEGSKQFRAALEHAIRAVQHPGAGELASRGDRRNVGPLARAAVAAGVDALFIEVHPDPDRAPCDGLCQLRIEDLDRMLVDVCAIAELVPCEEPL